MKTTSLATLILLLSCFVIGLTGQNQKTGGITQPAGSAGVSIPPVTLSPSQLQACVAAPCNLVNAPGAGLFFADISWTVTTSAGSSLGTNYSDIASSFNFCTASEIINNAGFCDALNNPSVFIYSPFSGHFSSPLSVASWTQLQQNYFPIVPADNQPLQLQFIVSATDTPSGAITAANVTAGNAGLLYAIGDTGTITNNDPVSSGPTLATYQVTSIGAGGTVTGFILTNVGFPYYTGTGVGTTPTTGIGDGNFEVDITALLPFQTGDISITIYPHYSICSVTTGCKTP